MRYREHMPQGRTIKGENMTEANSKYAFAKRLVTGTIATQNLPDSDSTATRAQDEQPKQKDTEALLVTDCCVAPTHPSGELSCTDACGPDTTHI